MPPLCQDGYTYADCCGSTIAPHCFPGRDGRMSEGCFFSVAFPSFEKRMSPNDLKT